MFFKHESSYIDEGAVVGDGTKIYQIRFIAAFLGHQNDIRRLDIPMNDGRIMPLKLIQNI